ncbi:phosphonate ABC transporter ATP-binding protein [Thalassospira tepidiphila]|jgi:phosphonate transport system ATP-binding protein|uniref:phosphonate ABC transporter ATP-binding protein n=1 Tax=Thalassospira TaxID=168934 RepID=UPI001BCFE2FA|nr:MULTISPECIES: phosphonate ABC transporter ATP-binding protein [Thalassospira]MBS8274281.1 phosphonate ABC transporter ATP-binding protein [Thalassospira tepidiphila]|tara:strand:- start:1003 stop:1848 length:846 start_codon:yes stop_codon:yes gene_type:complete
MLVVDISGLNKSFTRDKRALSDVKLQVREGEMVALIGASGSGKSTLIRHIAGLLRGDRDGGKIAVFGEIIQENGKISRGARKVRTEIGVVFQQFNLVSRLSVLTNVLMGLLGRVPAWRGSLGLFTKAEKRRAMSALSRVGIDAHASKKARNLSGGQQQRAAIARTITQGARLILADEPIASLDPASSRKVMNTLDRVNREDNVTVIVSLHQVDYAKDYCKRTIAMRDGEVVFDGPSSELTPQFLQELYGEHSSELFADGAAQAAEPAVKPIAEKDLAVATS